MVLEQTQMLGDDLLGRRPFEPEMPQLQPQTFLQIARRDADRIERLDVLQGALHVRHRPLPHRGDFLDRCHEVPVVVQIAENGPADFLEPFVVGLEGELPEEVVEEGCRARECVLDGRQFLDL
jgi:hypothetical protein